LIWKLRADDLGLDREFVSPPDCARHHDSATLRGLNICVAYCIGIDIVIKTKDEKQYFGRAFANNLVKHDALREIKDLLLKLN